MEFSLNVRLVPQEMRRRVEDLVRTAYPQAQIVWEISSRREFLLKAGHDKCAADTENIPSTDFPDSTSGMMAGLNHAIEQIVTYGR